MKHGWIVLLLVVGMAAWGAAEATLYVGDESITCQTEGDGQVHVAFSGTVQQSTTLSATAWHRLTDASNQAAASKTPATQREVAQASGITVWQVDDVVTGRVILWTGFHHTLLRVEPARTGAFLTYLASVHPPDGAPKSKP
jgi:hypothetical protein